MKKLLGLLVIFISSGSLFAQSYAQEGIASFYADKFEGRKTASGDKYKHSRLTAAHRTLPFGTILKVTNLDNQKSVQVKINDRGPFVEGRIIDLSKSAAKILDFVNKGLVKVKIEVVNAGDGKGNSYSTNPSGYSEYREEKEFYDFNITRINPSGYGVQIGNFKEMVNLVRLADNLKASYRKKVIVRVSIVKEEKYYKIIIGDESSRQKAGNIKKKLQKRYPDCFIVNFKDV